MHVGCAVEQIAHKPGNGAERADDIAGPPTNEPSGQTRRQEIERRDHPFASRKIIHYSQNKGESDARNDCEDFWRQRNFRRGFHKKSRNLDDTDFLTNLLIDSFTLASRFGLKQLFQQS